MEPVVVVPTYQERDSIEVLLDRLLAVVPGSRVLVVDDGSPDGTGEVVRARATADARVLLLERQTKDGLGSAYRAGYQQVLAGPAVVVCQMDADLSHAPEQVPALLTAVEAGADLAIGSRYVPGGDVQGWTRHRVLLSRMANLFVRVVTGCPVRDATSGFRVYRADTLRAVEVQATRSNGYAFQIEMTLRAWSSGLEVREVPISFVEREHGRSKLSGAVGREALVSVLRWGWRLRTR